MHINILWLLELIFWLQDFQVSYIIEYITGTCGPVRIEYNHCLGLFQNDTMLCSSLPVYKYHYIVFNYVCYLFPKSYNKCQLEKFNKICVMFFTCANSVTFV